MSSISNKRLINALCGNQIDRIPIWLMRQAGRHLPEYNIIRKKAGSFLDLCYSSDLATEITYQPIKRYDVDAAIIFSDILVVPDALGQDVKFKKNYGPILQPIRTPDDINTLTLQNFHEHLTPIYKTINNLRKILKPEVTLLGFCGAPWTVATYMIEGRSSKYHSNIQRWAYGDPKSFQRIINLLVVASSEYLIKQLSAGVDAVQIFDSWAGTLSETNFLKWCLEPTTEIVKRVRKVHPTAVIIGFPKGIGSLYKIYSKNTKVNAVSIDTTVSTKWAAKHLQPNVCVQGNLDPQVLVTGGKNLEIEIENIINNLGNKPFIFNLGHGILPDTPVSNVKHLINHLRFIENGALIK